ncbi:MAG TPA: SpoIIE family protein phosphatase, partial [Leptospiraceae bacterium]|nr:SpoIIE family protein phosphatase [Leptospiraceae bacterium]
LMRFLIHKLIIKPILTLNQGSEELAHGNLDYKIDIDRKDEIGSLGKSFNYMAENLKSTFQQIKDYNEKLEEKVAIRTSELSATLDKVQLLKNQQDGDYFLTTLLMNPLMQNRSRSRFIKIEFLIKQKKQFSFRNRSHHLGGDICISGDLVLSGKKYVMYFNGDAMGKSMQGAGGALVMGSMLNSILARSVTDRKMQSTSPVQWLTDSFFEIQKVMEAFDGSMLVSGIFGLAEEEKGKIHYINAEHPFSILYRDGTTVFVEEHISAHKFGMMENNPEILTFQMRNNDIIFCASDGKDDIKYFDENDPDKINEDEYRIFETVREASGDLREILRILESKGDLTDDLSILKLTFSAEDGTA